MANVDGDSGNNRLTGTGQGDRIRGFGGKDWLYGLAGNDRLEGGAGADNLRGDGGRDLLIGGTGRDLMYGGAGADTFVFDDRDAGDATAGLADVIRDFSSGDILDLIDIDVNYFAYDTPDPGNGAFSIWHAHGNTYVTWNTFGAFHDIEITGFSGDALSQIRWYQDDYRGDVNTTERIADGQTKTGTIEVAGDTDWFRLSVSQERLYTFDIHRTGGGDLNAYVDLFYADGEWAGDPESNLSNRVLSPGTYYVEASDYEENSTGAYQLTVSSRPIPVDDYAGNASTVGRISPGETLTGELGVPFDRDWIRVRLVAGRTYTIDLRGEESGSGTLSDPDLILYNSNGEDIAEENETRDAQIIYTADASAYYFIEAFSFYGDIGTYELSVHAASVSAATDADPLLMT